MNNGDIPQSFGDAAPAAGPAGQLAHPAAITQLQRLEETFYRVGDSAWCLVGNGLSNQSFVRAPDGLIAIDTGESIEEELFALRRLRREISDPVRACIYTHFHYCNGTRALLAETAGGRLDVYAHSDIEANLRRFAGETAPRGTRGIAYQFGLALPDQGADGLLSCGLGRFLRNAAHVPFTPGHIPATHTFDQPVTLDVAGLETHFFPAPSDATDSITVWMPALDLCINNLLWPALYNVFAIRGEEYRDPRVLLAGLDQILEFAPQHLIGTHGPPLTGKTQIRDALIAYRDSIQFLWDQTVRGANRGLTLDELTRFVQLPASLEHGYFTQQFYGVVEHHVKQIYTGLFGWFDEDVGKLFPLGDADRAARLVDGFGGIARVRDQIDAAVAAGDYRWALDMAGWTIKLPDAPDEDRARCAAILRAIGTQSMSANVRNWCLTRARVLDGSANLDRFMTHRFRAADVLAQPGDYFVPVLRVMLDPAQAEGVDDELRFDIGGAAAGLRIRHAVAIPTSGADASLAIAMAKPAWADLLGGKSGFDELVARGAIAMTGETNRIHRFLHCFDHPGLRA